MPTRRASEEFFSSAEYLSHRPEASDFDKNGALVKTGR
jgi:hypothetical protein